MPKSMLNAYVDNLILKIFGGFNEDYKDLCTSIRVHDSPITLDELHGKLINFEAHHKYEAWKKSNLYNMPDSANPAYPFIIHLKNNTKILLFIQVIVYISLHRIPTLLSKYTFTVTFSTSYYSTSSLSWQMSSISPTKSLCKMFPNFQTHSLVC